MNSPIVDKKIRIEPSGKSRARVIISGRVHGVLFRSTLRSQAKFLEVNGWTKNRIDGGVEAVFEGEHSAVEKMIVLCYEGPPGAFVNDVKVEWEKPKYDLKGFVIRY